MPFSGTGILREIYNNSRNAKKIARGFFFISGLYYRHLHTKIYELSSVPYTEDI